MSPSHSWTLNLHIGDSLGTGLDRATCPYHLRRLELRAAVISCIPSLAHNKSMNISSLGSTPQIHRIIDLSFWRSPCKSGVVGAHILLPWRKAERSHTGVKHLPTNCEGYVLGCEDWQELLELSPGSTTPGYNGKRKTATSKYVCWQHTKLILIEKYMNV